MKGEAWRPVPGFEGIYEVSDHGRVRSLERTCLKGYGERIVKERILSGKPRRYGYTSYVLRKDGKSFSVHGHILVMRAFVGLPKPGQIVCHNDSDGSNNCLENLRYDTAKSNSADRIGAGTSSRGERHPQAKLTEDDVISVRTRHAAGERITSLAREYGIEPSGISGVCAGRLWRHVGGPITKPEPLMTVERVIELRTRRAAGETTSGLAIEYGISRVYANFICNGRLWTEAGGPLTKRPTSQLSSA
jgi:hypothetical protein